ncbi:CoA transferase [Ramlibacter terrae]|uniref:CoA transferase n=1 Tax=Ramlibacter terrae TaxID=2732511 RepID=A0ABX6P838_9BURK|nr:CoA transferase [Ramlibacter terrae]
MTTPRNPCRWTACGWLTSPPASPGRTWACCWRTRGADVVKLEPPEGDWSRVLGCSIDEFSPFSVYYNRGKRSLAIDLKSAAGRALALEIACSCDIVIESFRPGVMKRLGLDHETLRRHKPGLIYLSMSGFGQDGPDAQLPATDTVIRGYSGLMSLNKDAQGAPQRFPSIIIDVVSGLYGFQAVMGAVVAKLRYGRGAYIDCSLLQSALALQAPSIVKHRFEKGQPTVMYVPLGVLATQDAHVSISVNRDEHFTAFCRAIERPELADDPAYSTLAARITNEKPLMALIRDEFRRRTTDEWVARLQAEGILHARIRTYDELLADPELQRAGMLDWLLHTAVAEPLPIPNIPAGPRATAYGVLRECPRVGQHTAEILTGFGWSADRVAEAVRQGVVTTQRRTRAPSSS